MDKDIIKGFGLRFYIKLLDTKTESPGYSLEKRNFEVETGVCNKTEFAKRFYDRNCLLTHHEESLKERYDEENDESYGYE
jgi:hypothetical protein